MSLLNNINLAQASWHPSQFILLLIICLIPLALEATPPYKKNTVKKVILSAFIIISGAISVYHFISKHHYDSTCPDIIDIAFGYFNGLGCLIAALCILKKQKTYLVIIPLTWIIITTPSTINDLKKLHSEAKSHNQ